MSEPDSLITRRDSVWHAVLVSLSKSHASIKIRDVKMNLEREVSDRTIHRTMSSMMELGWLQKDRESGHYWFPGPRALESLSGIDEETRARVEQYLEASQEIKHDRDEERQPERGPEPEIEPDNSSSSLIDDDIREDVSRISIPGSGSIEDERREAVERVIEYMKEHGSAAPAELKDEFYDTYGGNYSSPNSWWKNLIYPSLSESTLVESGGEGTRHWFYRG